MTETQQENFGQLSLDKKIVSALHYMGFEEPSPIQAATIPLALAGEDIVGQAQTGTGKTAAFGIPIVQNISDHHHIQALVLTPTRELAIQVAEELTKIGRISRIRALPVYGGQPIERQIKALKNGVEIVIGTPGRLLDHLNRRTIKLDQVRFLVLDEADEMLDMGFVDDIEAIMAYLPPERQTMLFSATMPRPILSLSKKYMKAPKTVAITKEELTVPNIQQYYYEVKDKVEGLCRLLDTDVEGKLLIFCRTKKGVDDLNAALGSRGYLAEAIHGDLSQFQRDRVMKRFREGSCEVLIATDVAARGLDIDNISHVINYDIPQDPESYVHRIGRTGRYGAQGVALTFITPREFRQLKLIERIAHTRIQRRQLPTEDNVIERQREQILSKLRTVLELDAFSPYLPIAQDILEDYGPAEALAAALKLGQEGSRALEAPEPPLRLDLQNTGARPGMVRLFITIGRSQKVTVRDIINSIAIEADIPARDIGQISIYDKFTFVEVPEDVGEKVLAAMDKNTIKGYKVNIEPAKLRK